MLYLKKCILYINLFFITTVVDGVKVDMKASIELGEEVVKTINEYLKPNNIRAGRRFNEDSKTLNKNKTLNDNEKLIKESYLCENIYFCNNEIRDNLEHYVISLINAMDNIVIDSKERLNFTDYSMFIQQYYGKIKEVIVLLKRILKDTGTLNEYSETTIKLIMKKICGIFQTTFTTFLESWKINDQILNKKVVLATSMKEIEEERDVCQKLFVCRLKPKFTKFLIKLINSLLNMSEDINKKFLRIFYEVLSSISFNALLNENIENEFKNVMNDLSFKQGVSAKMELKLFLSSIEYEANLDIEHISDEVLLIHTILSDMDYIYNNDNFEDFNNFLHAFDIWKFKGDKQILNQAIEETITNITKRISLLPEMIYFKIMNEVKVLIELVIDRSNKAVSNVK